MIFSRNFISWGRNDQATMALKWENLALPIAITVDNASQRYVDNLRREFRSSPGFSWEILGGRRDGVWA